MGCRGGGRPVPSPGPTSEIIQFAGPIATAYCYHPHHPHDACYGALQVDEDLPLKKVAQLMGTLKLDQVCCMSNS